MVTERADRFLLVCLHSTYTHKATHTQVESAALSSLVVNTARTGLHSTSAAARTVSLHMCSSTHWLAQHLYMTGCAPGRTALSGRMAGGRDSLLRGGWRSRWCLTVHCGRRAADGMACGAAGDMTVVSGGREGVCAGRRRKCCTSDNTARPTDGCYRNGVMRVLADV